MYDQLQSLDAITINFNEAGINTINIVLAFIMFGVALGIRPAMFKEVFSRPKSVTVGLLLQWIGLPALTFLLCVILSPVITPMVALGMILVASCPGGNISNFMSSFSKGNVELSVSMTAVSTCTATFITPINFAFWGKMYVNLLVKKGAVAIPELTIAFWPMFWQVCLLLGIPIVLGMLFTKYFPVLTEKLKKPMQVTSLLFFLAMVVISFSQNFTLFINHIWYVFFIVMAHNLLALSLGYWGARAAKLPVRDRRSLTIEVGIQNSGLGLVLLFNPNIFPQEGIGGMLFITAWWGIWHIISGLTVASIFRRKSLKDHETC
jgi:BASS family bile acid:Na+ symporter